jgi:alginate production protein
MSTRYQLNIAALLVVGFSCIAASVQAEGLVNQQAGTTTETINRKEEVFRQDNGETIRKEPLRINPGDKRPADQYKVEIFGRPLTIGGAYELEPRYTEDRRLDPHRDDDIANVYQDLKLELFYQWSKSVSFFVQSDVYYDPDVYAETKVYDKELGAKLTQAWLFVHRLFDSGFSLQIGRQRIADKRQWWWNENLDAARLYFGEDDVFAEIMISKELGVKRTDRDFIEPLHNRVFRVQGDVFWKWTEKQNVSLFFLSQLDTSDTQQVGDVVLQDREDSRDGDLTWLGARAMGKIKFKGIGKFAYWLDSATVFGTENTLSFENIDDTFSRVDSRNYRQVWAWGLDAGLTWYSNWFLEPYFTLGYAQGSGDNDPSDGLDTNFRQTGIHNNKVKFSGSQRFRYYGELFRPELSNLKIMTAAVGIPLSEHSSIDLLYHHYAQTTPSNFLRNSRIRATPNGIESQLGDEVDLVISLDEWKHLQFQAAGSLFIAGDAFGEFAGNTSFQIALTAKYSF